MKPSHSGEIQTTLREKANFSRPSLESTYGTASSQGDIEKPK
jgi:hypothetical protein